MPSCTGTDVQTLALFSSATPATAAAAATAAATAAPDCPKERFCYERDVLQKKECRPGKCRYGGREHDRPPCPDHDPSQQVAALAQPSSRAAHRAGDLAKLVRAVRSATVKLHAAARARGLRPNEISAIRGLHLWLRHLLDEQAAAPASPRKKNKKSRKNEKK